jgi:hypothetical protein
LGRAEVEGEVEDADARRALDDEVRVGLEGRQVGRRRQQHHVGLAGAQRQHAGALFGHGAEDHLVEGRAAAPVVVVGLEHDAVVGAPLDELEGAGADRGAGERVAAHRLDGGRADDRRVRHGGDQQQRAERLRGDDVDGELVDDLGADDGAGERAPAAGRVARDGAVPGVLHRVRVEGRAVVEGHALSQGEAQPAGSTNSQEVARRPSISMSWLTVMSGSRIWV